MERTSITPDQLLRIFNEAPSSNVSPSKICGQEKFYTHPPLLPGEQIISQQDHVTCVDTFDDITEGVLHITTYRVIFAGSHMKHGLDENEFVDADPEEVARRGHHFQTSSRKASPSHSKCHAIRSFEATLPRKPNKRLSAHNISKKIKSGGVRRGLRHSQSMKGKNHAVATLPGVCEQSVKLQTLRPIILSNIEHIDHSYEVEVSIPLSSIFDIKKFSKKNLPKDKQMFLLDGFEIFCSNIQSHRFCPGLMTTIDAEAVMKIILQTSKIDFSKLFAFTYKSSIILPTSCTILDSKDAPNFYKFEVECDRLKLFHTGNWQIHKGTRPLHYPAKVVVPISVTKEELTEIADVHRGEGCFPVVCWRHINCGAVMLRSPAALFRRGLKDSRCPADEKYLVTVSELSEAATEKLVVFTEQIRQSGGGLLNSSQQVTQMTGQLTPQEGETFYYPNIKFMYAEGIPDVKSVKQSAYKLQAVLANRSDDSKWLSALDDCDWLMQVSELLKTATHISVAMDCDKSSVMISYEDGMDRTAQVTSLSQLLLDPFYRTVAGFQILIQKEWLSFGHKFYSRTMSPQAHDDYSPVFLQWLDCVWQVLQQFPFSFEFNSLLLEVIAEHVYSSRFGTFIANAESEREEEEYEDKTISLWTWLNVTTMANPEKFINLRYKEQQQQRVLRPLYRIPYLKLWSSFYVNRYRYDHVHDASKAAELEALKLEDRYEELQEKYCSLIRKLAEVDSEDYSSTFSFHTATLHRALQKKSSNDHFSVFKGSRNSSLDNGLDASGTWPSEASNLSEEDPDTLMSSMKSLSMPRRRMTRSRSLDDMLTTDLRQKRAPKKTTLLRRVGSSKFYTEQIVNAVNAEPTTDVRNLPISEKYNSLKEYLDSEGIDLGSEKDVIVTESQCCGYMVKQGQVRRSWKRRWFVLDLTRKCLAYFETEKADIPKGAISCKAITRVYEHKKCGKSKNRFLFCVDTPDRTYTMYAPSEQSMNIWITCLTISPAAIELQRDET